MTQCGVADMKICHPAHVRGTMHLMQPPPRLARPVQIAVSLLAPALLLVSTASAQPVPTTGGSGSTMGQGAASITTRSDVRLALESDRGTNNERLQAIGRAVGLKMADVRACYTRAAAADPTVTGELRLRVSLDGARGRPAVEVTTDLLPNDALQNCVLGALRGVDLQGVGRPAAAIVSLEFANSAARGTQAVHDTREQQVAAVGTNAAGQAQAQGTTGERELSYSVTAVGTGTSATDVAAVQRAITDGLAGLLDCRRRAGRRGASPAGVVTVTAEIGARNMRNAVAASSTVADQNSSHCAERALEQMPMPPGEHTGRVSIVVTYRDANGSATPGAPTKAPPRRPRR